MLLLLLLRIWKKLKQSHVTNFPIFASIDVVFFWEHCRIRKWARSDININLSGGSWQKSFLSVLQLNLRSRQISSLSCSNQRVVRTETQLLAKEEKF